MIFQYFSRHISFSRTFQESTLNSSSFQACANPVIVSICMGKIMGMRRVNRCYTFSIFNLDQGLEKIENQQTLQNCFIQMILPKKS